MATMTQMLTVVLSVCCVSAMAHDPIIDAILHLQQLVVKVDQQNENITAKLYSLNAKVDELEKQLASRVGQ